MPTICLTLADNTVVTLKHLKHSTDDMNYAIDLNGGTKCLYSDFEFAWEDLGKVVRGDTLQEALAVL